MVRPTMAQGSTPWRPNPAHGEQWEQHTGGSMDLTYAEGWRPEDGDTIVGTVTDIAVGRSSQGAQLPYPIVTIDPDDGGDPVAVHGFHTALKARLGTLKPRVGERIGIKFVGMRQHKTVPTQQVADYIVRIEGRGAENVWAQFDEAPVPPTPAPTSDTPVSAADFAPAQPAGDDDIPF